MRNIREKFKKNVNFVKPLYRKVKTKNRHVDKNVSLNDESANDFVNKKQSKFINKEKNASCSYILVKSKNVRNFVVPNHYLNTKRIINLNGDTRTALENMVTGDKPDNTNDVLKINNYMISRSWLRVFPASQLDEEPFYVTILQYVVCQVGIATFLATWTLLWVMVIHYFEGPNEITESMKYLKEQNQIIIDLATELRQVTPMSQKWRQTIEARIQEEGKLAIEGAKKGVTPQGQYWTIPGTFLSLIYIMTTLGYGSEMPHTTYGKICVSIYTVLGLPFHIYLLVNTSACIIAHVEKFIKTCAGLGKLILENDKENTTSNWKCREKALKALKMIFIGRCIPLSILLYYIGGVLVFGVSLSRTMSVFIFPHIFTASGKLAEVPSHTRIFYALYLEGGIFILACACATVRRLYGAAFQNLCFRYRLYSFES